MPDRRRGLGLRAFYPEGPRCGGRYGVPCGTGSGQYRHSGGDCRRRPGQGPRGRRGGRFSHPQPQPLPVPVRGDRSSIQLSRNKCLLAFREIFF